MEAGSTPLAFATSSFCQLWAMMLHMNMTEMQNHCVSTPVEILEHSAPLSIYSGSQKYVPTLQAMSATPSLLQSG